MSIEIKMLGEANDAFEPRKVQSTRSVNDSIWSNLEKRKMRLVTTTGHKRIMLVDDDEMILEPLKDLLTGDNILVDAFDDPLEALKNAKNQAYDVVISDQSMPEMRGIDFIQALKAVQPRCVGIILSSCRDSSTLMNAINDAHVHRYVLKPWVDEELIEVVAEALEYHDTRTETERLADKARVSEGSMTRYRACMRDLETRYPGITQVERDSEGAIILNPNQN